MLTPQKHATVSYSQSMASKIDASIKSTGFSQLQVQVPNQKPSITAPGGREACSTKVPHGMDSSGPQRQAACENTYIVVYASLPWLPSLPPLPVVYPHERLRIQSCCTCNEHFFSSKAHFLCPAELMWSLADAPVVSERHFQIVRYLVCLYYNKTLLINLAPCLMFIL